jgi:membrane protease YdiL (CAAX protease family)
MIETKEVNMMTKPDASQPRKESFAMNISNLAMHHPAGFVLVLTVVWMVLLLVFMGTAAALFHKPYGDAMTASTGRLAVTACVLFLAWRLGWLKASGISGPGSWQAWLLALAGLIYLASASLYAFYGKVAFDFSSPLRLPEARAAVTTHFIAGLSEEILFRGLVLYTLIRAWGNSTQGILGSVLLAAALFALVHISQVFTYGISPTSALLLVLQGFVISTWWGALVVLGGSIWPAVILHFVVNAVVAVQGFNMPMVEPVILAYRQLLWFSLPLGALATGLLVKTELYPVGIEEVLRG